MSKKWCLENIITKLLKLFLFLLPWQTIWIYSEQFVDGTKWQYATQGFYATEALLWIIIILFMPWYWRKHRAFELRHKEKFSWTKERIFLVCSLIFILYSLISTLWSPNPGLALQQSLRIMQAFILFIILIIGPLKPKVAVQWLIAGAILPSLLGIYQFLTQSTVGSTLLGLTAIETWQPGASIIQSHSIGRWLRAYGSFPHPNILGGYLALVLSLLFCYQHSYTNKEYLQNPPAGRAGKKYEVSTPYALRLLSYALLFALFLTFSRTAWLAFAAGIVAMLLCCHVAKTKAKKYVALLLTFVALLTLIFLPLIETRLTGNTTHEITSITERTAGYQEALKLFKQQPLLGTGPGNYTLAAKTFTPNQPIYTYQPVHNVPLLILVELGIIGVFFLISILVSYGYWVKEARNKKQRYYGFLFLISYVVLLAFDHYLYTTYVGLTISAIYLAMVHNLSTKPCTEAKKGLVLTKNET